MLGYSDLAVHQRIFPFPFIIYREVGIFEAMKIVVFIVPISNSSTLRPSLWLQWTCL